MKGASHYAAPGLTASRVSRLIEGSPVPIITADKRGVAQPGSAPALGAGSRWFKSSLPDKEW